MIEMTKICDFEVWKEIQDRRNSRFLILQFKKKKNEEDAQNNT